MVRAAIEWRFLREHAVAAGLERIAAFMRVHPEWPNGALRKYAEDLASVESARPERVTAYFAEFPPVSIGGEITYAGLLPPGRGHQGRGRAHGARNLARGRPQSGAGKASAEEFRRRSSQRTIIFTAPTG